MLVSNNYHKLSLIFFILILFFALFSRFYSLETIPPGLYQDEAYNGLDAEHSLRADNYKIFYTDNNGREGLYIFLLSKALDLFQPNTVKEKIYVLRSVSAFIGVLTVIGVFILSLSLFKPYSKANLIALLAMTVLATSFWHINFSRIIFRAVLSPFFQVWSLIFIMNAFRKYSLFSAFIAGVVFGLGFYTYIAYLAFVLVIAYLFFYHLKYREIKLKELFYIFIAFFIASLITIIPLIRYIIFSPDFFIHINQLSYLDTSQAISIKIARFIHNITASIYMLFAYGDSNWRHNISGMPLLTPLALLGFFSLVFVKPKILIKNNFIFVLLLLWYIAGILPMIMTNEGIPHSLRAISCVIPTSILAAYGLYKLGNAFKKGKTLLAILIITQMSLSYYLYFEFWANNKNTQNGFAYNGVIKSKILNSYSKILNKYIVYNDAKYIPSINKNGNIISNFYWDVPIILLNFPDEEIKKENNYYFISQNMAKSTYQNCLLDCNCVFLFIKINDYNILKSLENDKHCVLQEEREVEGLFKLIKR